MGPSGGVQRSLLLTPGTVAAAGGRRAGGAATVGRVRAVDVLVVGAGPAGSAAALGALAAAPGATVVLVDRRPFPRDKPCGDGIGPEGVALLERLDAAAVLAGAVAVDRVRLTGPDGATVSHRVARPGYVLPRVVFDARLRELAGARGAELVTATVRELVPARGAVAVDGRWQARVVIAADGANSRLRRLVGLPPPAAADTAVAVRAYADRAVPPELWFGFPAEPWPAYAWCFPAGAQLANVGFGVFDRRLAGDRRRLFGAVLDRFGHLGLRDLRAHPLPLSTAPPRAAVGRVLFCGDAAGLVNPITGEGIATALWSGALAGAAAVRSDHPAASYRRALRRHLGGHLRQVRWAARAFRHRSSVAVSIAVGRHHPDSLEELLELVLGTGMIRPRTVGRLTAELWRHRRTRTLQP